MNVPQIADEGTRLAAVAVAAAIVLVACNDAPPSTAIDPIPHDHFGAPVAPTASMRVQHEAQQKIAQLRQWSASFHNLEKAVEAGYTINIGCIDETLMGVDASTARGMGYHLTGPEFAPDGTVDIDRPHFLVFAPHPRDAFLPPEERLAMARLVGFDYFVPEHLWDGEQPPEFFGQPFTLSEVFGGWMRHIYLWGNNPEGMFEDFNESVPLCTDLLVGD